MDKNTQNAHHKTVTEFELPELKEELVKAFGGTVSRTGSELPTTLRQARRAFSSGMPPNPSVAAQVIGHGHPRLQEHLNHYCDLLEPVQFRQMHTVTAFRQLGRKRGHG